MLSEFSLVLLESRVRWCVRSEKLVNKMKIIVQSFVLAAAILSAASQVHAGTVDPFIALNNGLAGAYNWRVLTMGSCTASGLLATTCDGGTAEHVSIAPNS